MRVERTKSGKKLKFDRSMGISMNIAIKHSLEFYRNEGYTQEQIDRAPDDSYFGNLRQMKAAIRELLDD